MRERKNVYSYLFRIAYEKADKDINTDAFIGINILRDTYAVIQQKATVDLS